MSAAEPILAVEGVHKSFGGLRAVAGASFAVARGSITALIGPNGAGKTTLFDLVTGFGVPDAGAVRFEGRPITGLPPHRIARRGLVRTFQLTRVFAAMSVLDNMMLAAPGQPGEALARLVLPGMGVRRRERQVRERALALLERAIALDPTYAHAHAWKACTLGQRWGYNWCDDRRALEPLIVAELQTALALDDNDSDVHRVLAAVNLVYEKFDLCAYHQQRALSLNPNDDLVVVQAPSNMHWLSSQADLVAPARTDLKK